MLFTDALEAIEYQKEGARCHRYATFHLKAAMLPSTNEAQRKRDLSNAIYFQKMHRMWHERAVSAINRRREV